MIRVNLYMFLEASWSWSLSYGEEIEKERREWEEKLAAADKKVSESQKALEDMKANAESSTRVHLVRAKTGVEEEELSVEDLEAKVKELEEMKNNSDSKLEAASVESLFFGNMSVNPRHTVTFVFFLAFKTRPGAGAESGDHPAASTDPRPGWSGRGSTGATGSNWGAKGAKGAQEVPRSAVENGAMDTTGHNWTQLDTVDSYDYT